MKIKIIEHKGRNENGEESTYYEFVNEEGQLVSGAFSVVDGRPYDVLSEQFVD